MASKHQDVEFADGSAPAEVRVELGWATLRQHSLLACVRVHEGGDGALLWLSNLSRCFAISAEMADWAAEASQLIERTGRCQLRHVTSITNRISEDSVWRSIGQWIEARQRAAEMGHVVDMLLARYVIGVMAERGVIASSFLDGCIQLYKASQTRNHRSTRRDWRDLLDVLQSHDKPLTTHILSIQSTTCRDFSIAADRVLKSRLSPVQSAINVKALVQLEVATNASTVTTESTDPPSTALERSVEPTNPIEVDEASDEEQTEGTGFRAGDSVSQYIRDQSAFVARRTRLGLEHRSSAPLAHVLEIVQHSQTALVRAEDPIQRASAFMIQLQLTLPVPLYVLLSLKCVPGDDIWLDITQASLQVARRHMTGSATAPDWFESTQAWSIRLPIAAAEFLQEYESHKTFVHLGDLLSGRNINLPDLEHAHQQTLSRFSDPHLQVWPSHWTLGIRAASVALLGSELAAAYVMSYPGLSAEGALHYFHPQQQQIDELTSRWHVALGLENRSGSHDTTLQVPPDIFGNQRISSGFSNLIQGITDLQRLISRSRGDVRDTLPHFKKLTEAVASIAVFVTAGRGMKVEEIKNGSLLIHEKLIHLDDKDVINGRGSRLIPRPDSLTWAMDVFLDAQALIATRLRTASGIRQSDLLSELSSRKFRFDAVCFQYFTMSAGVVQRVAVKAADIERMAREYFAAPRNFMRHVIVTHWTLSREDKTLLRALTGHAWNWSEAPGPCSTYSPMSLIKSIKGPLERILSHWLPACPGAKFNIEHTLVRFPARRIHMVHKHYRSLIEDGTQGPVFSRWHLAADSFSQSVRKDLTSDQISGSNELLLWLHIVFIDGLTELEDLKAVLATSSSFKRNAKGWCVSWARSGEAPDARSILLQAPTSLYLERIDPSSLALPIEDTDQELVSWLCSRIEGVAGKGFKQSTAGLMIASIASLWADLVLPTALQVAYCPANRAPIPTKRATASLINCTSTRTAPADQYPNTIGTRPHHSGCLYQLIKLIHRVGDNTQRLGEQKSRAAYLLEHIELLRWDIGSWTDVLIKALRYNIDLIRASDRRALQFSSISTYTSALSQFIADHEGFNFVEADELEVKQLSHDLLRSAVKRDAPGGSDATSAALWLLNHMRRQGCPVDLEVGDPTDWWARPTGVISIPVITEHAIEQSKSLLAQAHADSALRQEQIAVALDLLHTKPMRWMELAVLDPTHVLEQHQAVRIEAAGYSHIKTASAVRNIEVTKDLHRRLKHLGTRVSNLHEKARPLLFSRAAAGEDASIIPSWPHQEISWGMKCLLEDDFRIHHLRANAITKLLFPCWYTIFHRWVSGQANHHEVEALFVYSKVQASRCEETAVQAGHSHPATSVTYYLFAWPLLRALAMTTCNADLVPGQHYLKQLGISRAAWVKAAQRSGGHQTDPWSHLSKRAFGIKPVQSGQSTSNKKIDSLMLPVESAVLARSSGGDCQQTPLNFVRYLCLRACAVPAARAADFTRLSPRQRSSLEDLFNGTEQAERIAAIRARQGTSCGDRSSVAEARLVQSDDFYNLFAIVSEASTKQLSSLVSLLTPMLGERACTEQEITELATLFHSSDFVIELVFRRRGFDPTVAARLMCCPSVRVGHPVRDLTSPLRAFILDRNRTTSLVAKSRLRSVFSQICYFLHLVRHESSNEKIKGTSGPTSTH